MTSQTFLNETKLDLSLALGAVGWDDVNVVARLSYELCEALGGVASTPEDLANEWKYEGFDPEQDAFVVETRDRRIVGYAALFDVKDHCDLSGHIYVHPQFKGLGIERTLLRAMDTRAAVHIQLAAPDLRVFIRVTDHKDEACEAIFALEGYSPVRRLWRMGIDLDAAPPHPFCRMGLSSALSSRMNTRRRSGWSEMKPFGIIGIVIN